MAWPGDHVEIELAAFHEAAHALVALHHRRPVQQLQISTRQPGAGCTRFGPRMRWPAFDPTPGNIRAAWLQTLAKYSAEIRILLAGPLAEAKLLATPLRSLGARSDLQRTVYLKEFLLHAYSHLSRYSRLPDALPADFLNRQRQQTRWLIARPAYWRAIRTIAAALQRDSQLEGTALTPLVQAALDARPSDGTSRLFRDNP